MEKNSRRELIYKAIKESNKPLSGSALAKQFNVSRQIVVGDIALLRAEGIDVISTNSGYVLATSDFLEPVSMKLKHKTEDVYDVLCTIVDEGAKIDSVYIEHAAYGRIEAVLNIESRSDIRAFSEIMVETGAKSLGELSGNVHFYKISAKNQITMIKVQKALYDKGYIAK